MVSSVHFSMSLGISALCRYKAPVLLQTQWVLWRAWLSVIRDLAFVKAKLGQALVIQQLAPEYVTLGSGFVINSDCRANGWIDVFSSRLRSKAGA